MKMLGRYLAASSTSTALMVASTRSIGTFTAVEGKPGAASVGVSAVTLTAPRLVTWPSTASGSVAAGPPWARAMEHASTLSGKPHSALRMKEEHIAEHPWVTGGALR